VKDRLISSVVRRSRPGRAAIYLWFAPQFDHLIVWSSRYR